MSTIGVQGRLLSEADLDNIRQVREQHPQWSRQQLSVHLAQLWRAVVQWARPTQRHGRPHAAFEIADARPHRTSAPPEPATATAAAVLDLLLRSKPSC